MGANPTQAHGVALCFIAFTLIAGGFAAGGNFLYLILGLAVLAGSIMLFLKCKPWEQHED